MAKTLRSLAAALALGAGSIAVAMMAPLARDAARAGAPVAATGPEPEIAYARPTLGRVAVYRPAATPRGLVILLSDATGWTMRDRSLARRLSAQGALVTGVSTPAFLKALNARPACINPNYAIIDLARDIQHRLQLSTYRKPVLVGRGLGGSLAYATLAAGPNGAYRAALSIGFRPFLPGAGQWCRSGTLRMIATRRPRRGWVIAPARSLPSPWILAQPMAVAGALRPFLAAAGGGIPIRLPPGDDADDDLAMRIAPLLAPAQAEWTGPRSGAVPLPSDLPLTLVVDPAAPRTDRMAVLYSGDGGWVGLDKDLAAQLAKAGIAVVGVDSLSYFWSQRTPAGAAADLDAIIRGYSAQWHRPRVMLLGYSFGADVLPHIVGHLAPLVRAQVTGMAMLGLSASADFQFHLSSWLNIGSSDAYPTIPAIARLRGLPMLCIRGQLETDSACPAVPPGIVRVVTVPGGHHFDRNAPLLAQQIIGRLPR